MVYDVSIEQAQTDYPEFDFVAKLTPSAQKAAFRVRDENGDDLCLKIISPDYKLARLDREIRAMKSIDHPNVAHFKHYKKEIGEKDRHFIVEEYVEGSDMQELLDAGDAWNLDKAARFFSALCDGLTALHEQSIVHRDLKPSNVRVRPDGRPVIIDLGYALHLELPSITTSREGADVGTWTYFSPEQFLGKRDDVDYRTDLFVVGVLLYQALVGSHPFYAPGLGYEETKEAVCKSEQCFEVPEFVNLPNNWQTVIRRLLCKNRAGRPNSAQKVSDILRSLEID